MYIGNILYFGPALAIYPSMVIYISLLICLIGLLMYALSTNAKLIEIGRMTYFAGLLAFLLRISESAISVLK